MASEFGENRYKKYSQPSLDLIFVDGRESLNDRVGNVAVEFTRTQDTQASYYKSDGIIGYASTDIPRFDHDPTTGESLGLMIEEERTNRLLNSNLRYPVSTTNISLNDFGFDPANTVDPRGLPTTSAPDGGLASKLVFANGYTRNAGDNIYRAGFFYSHGSVGDSIISVFVKPAEWTGFEVRYGNQESNRFFRYFDLTGAGNCSHSDCTIALISNGWYRITLPNLNQNRLSFIPSTSYQSSSTGDGTSGIYIWGAQLEVGSFATSYIPTPTIFTSRASEATFYNENGIVSTASTDVARSDAYFPDENGIFYPVGLLLEEERTNLHVGSTTDALNQGIVGLTQGSVTATDPTGSTSTVETWTVDTSTGDHDGYRFYNNTYVDFTWSLFVKANGITRIQVSANQRENFPYIEVDLTDGSIINQTDSYATATPIGGGWIRISASSGGRAHGPGFWLLDSSGNRSFTGNGTDGVYVWGIQLEQQSGALFPTSYIPTTSSTSTRAADISSSSTSTRGEDEAKITGAGFSSFYNRNAGTFYLDTPEIRKDANFQRVFEIGTSSPIGNRINARVGSSVDWGGGGTRVNITPDVDLGSDGKYAFSFDSSNLSATYNNQTVNTTTHTYSDTDSDRLTFFDNGANQSGFGVYGYIKRFTYWPTRLSDSDLQRLTE